MKSSKYLDEIFILKLQNQEPYHVKKVKRLWNIMSEAIIRMEKLKRILHTKNLKVELLE
jgi:hypothetical protein